MPHILQRHVYCDTSETSTHSGCKCLRLTWKTRYSPRKINATMVQSKLTSWLRPCFAKKIDCRVDLDWPVKSRKIRSIILNIVQRKFGYVTLHNVKQTTTKLSGRRKLSPWWKHIRNSPHRAFEIKIKKLAGQKYRGHSLKTESEKVPRAFAIMRNSESRDYLSAAATEHQLKNA